MTYIRRFMKIDKSFQTLEGGPTDTKMDSMMISLVYFFFLEEENGANSGEINLSPYPGPQCLDCHHGIY
jgi:hypothetical protein